MSKLIDFAELRRRARFEQVLSHYNLTPLGKGAKWSILCPFHNEKKPSCSINLDKRVFHCFGCGAKGNVLDFIVRMEGCSLTEGAEKLAEICGIPLAELTKATEPVVPDRETRQRGSRKLQDARDPPTTRKTTATLDETRGEAPVSSERPINAPLSFTLKLDPSHSYLSERGLSAKTVETFGLGFCSRGMMKGRICIPIHNERGELVAYAGRWPGEVGFPENEDRYKLPAGFEKTQVLFNLHRVPLRDHVIVVEGYFSVMRLHELGFENVVALMGRSISERQVELLAERFSHVTLLLDGDTPGRSGTETILPKLARLLFVRDAVLPDGTQPDTVAEEALRTLLESAR
jgi:DNA primase